MSSLWFSSDLHELCKQGTRESCILPLQFWSEQTPRGTERQSTATKCTFSRNIELACARAGWVLMIWSCCNDKFLKECVSCFNSPLPKCGIDGGCVAKYSPIHLTRKQRQMIKEHQYSEAANWPCQGVKNSKPSQKVLQLCLCYKCRCTGSIFSQAFLRLQAGPDNKSSLHGTAWCMWQSHVHVEWQRTVREKMCF